jgi:hypothetical protein
MTMGRARAGPAASFTWVFGGDSARPRVPFCSNRISYLIESKGPWTADHNK